MQGKEYRFTDRPYGADIDLGHVLETEDTAEEGGGHDEDACAEPECVDSLLSEGELDAPKQREWNV